MFDEDIDATPMTADEIREHRRDVLIFTGQVLGIVAVAFLPLAGMLIWLYGN